jgi:tRNA A37 methylthiotransferase MiaB
MNVNDTEILNAIMTNTGYERTDNLDDANVVFLVTVSKKQDHLKMILKFKPLFIVIVCN